MKFLLIYFTGTYNTRFLTNTVEKSLVKKGHSVEKVEINAQTQAVTTNGYDYIGFSYPIYGFNTPLSFDRYVKKLRFEKGQKYFIYKNSGETMKMNNSSSTKLKRLLKKRNLVCSGEYHFVMPYNIHFKYDSDFVREILDKDRKLTEIMIYNLENGFIHDIKSTPIYDFAGFFVGIVKIAGNINSFLYRVKKDKCSKCLKCVNTCPNQNIYIKDGKIKFRHHCDMCMRCSFFCPQDAIRIGFLDWWGWRVNGDYNLAKLSSEKPLKPYITEKSAGFYKCFISTFKEIDCEYERIFGKDAESAERLGAVAR